MISPLETKSSLYYLRWLVWACMAMSFVNLAIAGPKQKWSIELGYVPEKGWALQIFADGTGGAAAVIADGGGPTGFGVLNYTVVWVNAKGKEIYRKTFTTPEGVPESDVRIVAATRLAIVVNILATNKTFVVSRAGEEIEVDEETEVPGVTNGSGHRINNFHDASGFFGFRFSEDGTNASLVRFLYREDPAAALLRGK
jgi:hypothetical protein